MIGFLVNDLGKSQRNFYMIQAIAKGVIQNKDFRPAVFTEDVVPPFITPMCSVMPLTEAFGFNGSLIATTVSTARKLEHLPADRKFYYVYDAEWIRPHPTDYTYFHDCFQLVHDGKLKLLARSESHAKLLQNCFNVDIHAVVDDFNLEQMVSACLTK